MTEGDGSKPSGHRLTSAIGAHATASSPSVATRCKVRRVQRDLSERAYGAFVLACALGYLAIQLAYLRCLPLVNDEFDGAYDVYRLRSEIPYRDFAPYKTVLGYYLQLPGLLLAKDVWSGIFAVKHGLATLNALLTVLAAWLCRPLFSRLALALALPCWLLMSNWLERSSDLRVDTLTAWPALFSVVALLRGRPALAGALAATSFLVSQKGIYFIAASGALLAMTVAVEPDRRAALRSALRFGVAAGLPIALYFGLFALVSSTERTTQVMFLAHREIALTQIYPNIRKFWRISLMQNPGLYALGALGLGALAARARRRDVRCAQLFAYTAALTALLIWHKQPWPYFFVLLAPTAFLACAAAFEVLGRAQVLDRPLSAARYALLAVPLALAVVMPARRMPVILAESQAYQRHMVELTAALVADGSRYLAAVDLLYDRKQSPAGLRRLSISARKQLDTASPERLAAIQDELERKPPKVLVRNERFNGMPPRVRSYLWANYAHYWGNVELYAPRFASSRSLTLSFPGRYRVELDDEDGAFAIDGRAVKDGEVIALAAGRHALDTTAHGRLHWQPPETVVRRLDPRFKERGELIGNAYNR